MKFKELTDSDKAIIYKIHVDNSLPWDTRMSLLMSRYGISERTARKWIAKLGFSKFVEPENEVISKAKVKTVSNSKYYFLSWAQNATPVHTPFLHNIKTYAEYLGAELYIVPGRYRNPTSVFTDQKDDWWDTSIEDYLTLSRMGLHKGVTLAADVKVQPTASDPLSGFEGLTGESSTIFGHPRVHLKTLPVLEGHPFKFLFTTGAVTIPNYTDSKAGKKGEFHHTYGFVIVEVKDDDTYFIRQVTADPNGNFYDILNKIENNTVSVIDSVESYIMGDLHSSEKDEPLFEATLSYLDILRPKNVVLHDVFSGKSISHHERKDPIKQFQKLQSGDAYLEKEIDITLDDIETLLPYNPVIVRSNHDCYEKTTEFLTETGWKLYEDINESDKLAQFDSQLNVSFDTPLARIEKTAKSIVTVESNYSKQMITLNHDVVYDGVKCKFSDIDKNHPEKLPSFGFTKNEDAVITDDMLRVLSWVLSDATIVFNTLKSGDKSLDRIQFKLSKERKIERLIYLLESEGIKYTHKKATMSGINKLQPYYIRIYSDDARKLYSYFDNGSIHHMPRIFNKLSVRQINLLFKEFVMSDGHTNQWGMTTMVSINKEYLGDLQRLAIMGGIPCSLRYVGDNSGKFKNSKPQYDLHWRNDNLVNGKSKAQKINISINEEYNDLVYCFEMPLGTLITRVDGKVAFSGNCWLDRWVVDQDWKKELHNSPKYLKYALVLLENRAEDGLFPYIVRERFGDRVRCLKLNDSFKICGWELAQHGDKGANGSRGGIEQFRRFNTKIITADSHVAHRKDGAISVGTHSKARMGFNNGPSSWCNADAIIHENGKAQHLIFFNNEFTTILNGKTKHYT